MWTCTQMCTCVQGACARVDVDVHRREGRRQGRGPAWGGGAPGLPQDGPRSLFQKLGSLNTEPALPSTSYLPATPSVVPASSYVPSSDTSPGERAQGRQCARARLPEAPPQHPAGGNPCAHTVFPVPPPCCAGCRPAARHKGTNPVSTRSALPGGHRQPAAPRARGRRESWLRDCQGDSTPGPESPFTAPEFQGRGIGGKSGRGGLCTEVLLGGAGAAVLLLSHRCLGSGRLAQARS